MYDIFDHTADLGIRVQAASLDALMGDAARGLFTVIAGDLGQIHPTVEDAFTVAGTDPTWLLFDWTSEVLAAFELRRMLYRDFAVTVDAHGLHARARGERYDPARHRLAHEIKAVTQHLLDVRRTAAGWEATLVVDI